MDVGGLTRFIISAKDETGPAAKSASTNLYSVGSAGEFVNTKLKQLAGVLTIGMFAGAIKSAIDAADAFNDLSKKVGLPVETIGALSYASKQSGVDLEVLTKGVVKLGVNMTEAAGGNKELGEAFKALGLNLRDVNGNIKTGDQALLELADTFAGIADGPEKAALAVKAFGKAGADMIPFLDEGSEKIRTLMEEYEKYSGVTTDVAAAADQFNDTLGKLSLLSKALYTNIAAALLPTLQKLADIFVETKTKGEGFKGVAEGVAVAVKVIGISALGVIEAVKALGTSLGAVMAAFSLAMEGDFKGAFSTLKLGFQDVKASVETTITRAKDIWNTSTEVMAAKAEDNLGKRPRAAIVKTGQEVNKLLEQFQALVAAIDGKDIGIDSGFAAKFALLTKAYNGEIQGVTLSLERYRELTAKLLNDQPWAKKQREELEKLIKVEQEYLDILKKQQDEATAALGRYAEDNRRLELEVSLIGQSNLVRQQALIIADAEITKTQLRNAGDVEGLRLLEEQIQKRLELAAIADQKQAAISYQNAWLDAITNVSQAGADFIVDFVNNGKSAFQNLWDSFKQWALRVFAEIAARKVVISLVGSLSPGLASAASGQPANLVDFLGSGGSGSGGLTGLLNLFTGGSGGLGGAVNTFIDVLGTGNGVMQAFTQALQSSTLGLGSLLGGIGLVATAAGALYSWIKSKGGGPKEGGFAASGATPGISGTDSSGARWFTPNQSDADLLKSVQGLQSQYDALLRALGGAGNATFAVGFDTDPKGKAPNRAHVGVFAGGQQVYNAAYGDLGKDPEALNATLALEAKRQLLAALQASEFPTYLQSIFDSLDASTASSEAIDQLLQAAAAVKQTVEIIGSLGGSVASLDPDQILSLVEAFGGLDQVLQGMAFLDANFTTDADKAAKASQQLNDAFASLGIGVPQTHQAFLDLLNSLDLTTQDGRDTYATLTKLGPLFVSVFGTAQDAATKTAAATSAAAEAEKALAEARAQAVKTAEALFKDQFYTDAEKNAQKVLTAWDAVHKAWSENAVQLAALGLDHIPTATGEFRALIESLDRTTPAGEALYQALILLAPSILDLVPPVEDLGDTADETAQKVNEATEALQQLAYQASQTAAQLAGETFAAIMGSINELVGGQQGDFGQKTGLRITLLGEQIAKYQALIDAQMAQDPYSPLITQYRLILQQLGQANTAAAQQLARFTVLAAQYDAQRAEQLVGLEDWYNQQKAILAGSPEALAALQVLFKQRWDDIINGTATGVSGTLEELAKLRLGILEYVQGLKVGNLSPSSPLAKLEEARKQYEAQLALAQGGNVEALGNITQYSNAYLELARQVFGSSTGYNSIFDQLIQQLTALGTPPATGGAEPLPVIAAAMPADSPIFSQKDGRELANLVTDLLEEIRDGSATQMNKQTATIAAGFEKAAEAPLARK